MEDIKKKITDFVSFDVANDYYDETKKDELVNLLKEILFEDDITVRKFLERLFSSAEASAKSFGLITKTGDVDEPSDIDTSEEDNTEEPEEISEELPKVENIQFKIKNAYVSKASEYLYE